MKEHIHRVIDGLNKAERAEAKARDYQGEADAWYTIEHRKYIHINCGGSGAFLCDKKTGELFNIKGYGVADKNKKVKADIGNIATVDPAWLHTKRYNYLR